MQTKFLKTKNKKEAKENDDRYRATLLLLSSNIHHDIIYHAIVASSHTQYFDVSPQSQKTDDRLEDDVRPVPHQRDRISPHTHQHARHASPLGFCP